jgi:hypothetical protein
MPPTLVLRDDPPGASTLASASNQTSQFQAETSTASVPGGLIAPLAVFIAILVLLLVSCV